LIRKLFCIFVSLYTTICMGAPENIEIWFLSEQTTAFLDPLIKKNTNKFIFSNLTVENDSFKCIPMGDGCFHPQLGYVDKDSISLKKDSSKVEKLKTFNATETSLVECDKNYYFDLYCGKAKKIKKYKKANLEIWIDTSSSFKNVDFSLDNQFCNRRTFVEGLTRECAEKVSISTFDVSLKELGTLDGVCVNYGTNDTKRIINWIENSDAKALVIVTDVSEYNSELANYLNSINAKIYGGDTKKIFSKDLQNQKSHFSKLCI
jgi:hypothetical protein